MDEQLFLYGVYSIHVRPLELNGARWDAEYEIRHREKAVKSWTTVGGDDGYADEAEAVAVRASASGRRYRARRRHSEAASFSVGGLRARRVSGVRRRPAGAAAGVPRTSAHRHRAAAQR